MYDPEFLIYGKNIVLVFPVENIRTLRLHHWQPQPRSMVLNVSVAHRLANGTLNLVEQKLRFLTLYSKQIGDKLHAPSINRVMSRRCDLFEQFVENHSSSLSPAFSSIKLIASSGVTSPSLFASASSKRSSWPAASSAEIFLSLFLSKSLNTFLSTFMTSASFVGGPSNLCPALLADPSERSRQLMVTARNFILFLLVINNIEFLEAANKKCKRLKQSNESFLLCCFVLQTVDLINASFNANPISHISVSFLFFHAKRLFLSDVLIEFNLFFVL